MQAKNLKSPIISENITHQLDRLVHQLDTVKHIAEFGFWLTTDELGILLNLDNGFVNTLNIDIKSKTESCKFFWRNFECILMDNQSNQDFWNIRNRQDLAEHIHNNNYPKSEYLSVIELPHPLKVNESTLLDTSTESKTIPSPYALINDFLSATQLSELLCYSVNKQADFVPTTNSANDPNYRRSLYLTKFPEFSELIIKLVRKITPKIIAHLNINNFEIGQIESQMTAHNHGNYYKIHNDNGSPDSATRVLTYVYYYNREPKPFTGGELVIYDSKIENGYSVAATSRKVILPTNNTIIFFPSHCMHEVLPVNCPSEYFADSRFTINGWIRHV